MTSSSCFRSLVCGSTIVLTSALLGCGASGKLDSPVAGSAFSGRVNGGQQPIFGATIRLYAAGSSGPGAGAVNLTAAKPPAPTDTQGNFTITGDYSCPSSTTQVYLVAQGGNPQVSGSNNNPKILLAAALGDCANLTQSSFISVNEVTTAAAAWALAPFLSPGGIVGASSTNAVGLRNAFANANKLVDVSTGTGGGPALPAGATIESAKLYTLANALSACVNSDGTTACNPLFQAATVGTGAHPSNTLDAALNVALNPSNNVLALFNVVPAAGAPFPPGLSAAPHDWTMSVTYTGGGLHQPTGLAVDSQGDVWAANYYSVALGGVVTEIPPVGSVQSFADSNLYESFGVAIDKSDNVWVTNEQSRFSINSGNGSITKFNSAGQLATGSPFSAGGINFPIAIAADTDGSLWIADWGDDTATHLANDGSSLSGSSGYASYANLTVPVSVALDANHNAWFGAEYHVAQVTPSGTIAAYSCTSCRYAEGLEVDQAGNVWFADITSSALIELGSNGATLQTLTASGGLQNPQGLAIDGNGNVWLTNYLGQTISAFTGASSGATSIPLSPSFGYGLDASLSEPFGIALDSSGSVWVAGKLSNAITQFVGLASPIATPLAGPPQKP